ncbi:hypothetical protein GQ473_06090 [archaeon]|nr:hypothetical protein [archaeon]
MKKKSKEYIPKLLEKGTKRTLEIATLGGYASRRTLDSETSRYMTICREVKKYVKNNKKKNQKEKKG